MKNEIIRFKVMHEDGIGYTVYENKSGRWYAYNNNYDKKRGLMILSPSYRVTNKAAEVSKARGIYF